MVKETLLIKASVILLAGGLGTRMNSSIPKQFLPLKNQCVARYSFDLFCAMPEVAEIVVVCHPEYQHVFHREKAVDFHPVKISFASPGERRQDSVYHGLQGVSQDAEWICIHDAARPFISISMVRRVLEAAEEHGAATTGMPIKFTVKEANAQGFVKKTLPRSLVWEIQTPQVIKKELLEEGFRVAIDQQVAVTDDVSLVELLNLPVKLVEGAYSNIKITTPEDLSFAQNFVEAEMCVEDCR